MDELMLDRLLDRAAADVTYPVTPRLRSTVVARIARERGVAPRPRVSLAVAAAFVIAVIVFGVALAVAPSRDAIADFFGVEGSRIEQLPSPRPGVTASPMPTSRDIEDIATPVSLSEAAAIAGFVPALPESGAPRSVYLVPAFALPAVVLSYERYDLWQVQLDDELVGKWLGGGTSLEDLTVSGRPARWISGGTHVVRFIGSDGTEMAGTRRIVERNTLIWRTPFAFYRIETDLPVGDALTIAESLP